MANMLARNYSRILTPACNLINVAPPRRTAIMWTDHRMARDVNNRKIVFQFAAERLRVNTLRKNKILPKELRECADREIAALPRRGSISYLHGRCVLTSRSRGLVVPWRMSRIAWRHLADHNNLSGVQRAIW
uniref:28S ribosomal protein S14, mitochondrial n=1 Tax=Strigamia maritima TaxID=126957 RepID=T1JMV7_STRMM